MNRISDALHNGPLHYENLVSNSTSSMKSEVGEAQAAIDDVLYLNTNPIMINEYETAQHEQHFDGNLPFGSTLYNEILQVFETDIPIQACGVPGPPSTKTFPGEYDFHVEIDSTSSHKKNFLYSHKTNCLFINPGHNFSVNLVWNTEKNKSSMYVRAMAVFADPADAEKRVETCTQHVIDDSVPSDCIKHNVLRSSRDLSASDVYYCGAANDNVWYSVVVKLAAPSSHAYYFVCKNSCNSGINRRILNLMFTLEDGLGTVLGCEIVGVRVCSCPKRDLKRAEELAAQQGQEHRGKRPVVDNSPRRKRLKVGDHSCDKVVNIPSLQVVGPRVAIAGLETMLSMMKQGRDIKLGASQSVVEINAKIMDLEKIIDNLQGKDMTASVAVAEPQNQPDRTSDQTTQ